MPKLEARIAKSKPWMRPGLQTDIVLHSMFYNHAVRVYKRPCLWILVPAIIGIMLLLLSPWAGGDERYSQVYPIRKSPYLDHLGVFGFRGFIDVIVTAKANAPYAEGNTMVAGSGKVNVFTEAGFAALRKVRDTVRKHSMASPYGPPGSPPNTYARSCLPARPTYNRDVTKDKRMHVIVPGKESCKEFHGGWTPAEANALVNSTGAEAAQQFMGEVKFDSNGQISSARSLRAIFELEQPTDDQDDDRRISRNWVRNFVIPEVAALNLGEFTAFAATETPVIVSDSGGLFTAAFILAGVLFIAGCHPKTGRGGLMVLFSGAGSVYFSIQLIYAVLAWLGVAFHTLLYSSSVLIAVIGMDDIFLLLSSLRRCQHANPQRRLATAVGESATAIFMTTLTDVIVFLAGTVSASPVTLLFCGFTAGALVIDFLLQMTVVVGIMAIDVRIDARGSRIPCVRTKDAYAAQIQSAGNNTNNPASDVEMAKMHTATTVPASPASGTVQTSTTATDDNSDTNTTTRIGVQPRAHDWTPRTENKIEDDHIAHTVPTFLGRTMYLRCAPVMTSRACMVINAIILAFLLVTAFLGYTTTQINVVGPDKSNVAGSRAALFEAMRSHDFPQAWADMYVMMPRGLEYHRTDVQAQVLDACSRLDALKSKWKALGAPSRCWLRRLQAWTNGTLPTTEASFISAYNAMVNNGTDEDVQVRYDVMWNGPRILTTRIVVPVLRVSTVDDAIALNASINGALQGHPLRLAGALVTVADAENLPVMVESLAVSGALAVILVTLVTSVLLVNPFSGLVVGFVMIAIVGCVLMAMQWFAVVLSVQLLVVGIISFGMGVDLVCHMLHAFNTTPGASAKERLRKVMGGVGPGVWYSGVTNLIVITLTVGGNSQDTYTALIVVGTSTFGLLFAFIGVPLLVQVLPFPPTLRDLAMQSKLQDRKHAILDETWDTDFEAEQAA